MFREVLDTLRIQSKYLFSILGAGVVLRFNGFMERTHGIAAFIVDWGMAFIIGYGVIRITLNLIWNIFFGRDFDWKIGILEMGFKKLKPIKVQEIAENTGDEEKSLKRMRIIMNERPKRGGGGFAMGFKKFMKKVNANKWTILGVGSIAAVGTLGAFNVIDFGAALDVIENLGDLNQAADVSTGAITLAALGAGAAVNLRAVLGKGPESLEDYEARKEKEKAEKEAIRQAKEDGTLEYNRTVEKLMADFSLSRESAEQVAKEQLVAKQKELEAKKAEEELAEAEKLAKKFNISTESALKLVKNNDSK